MTRKEREEIVNNNKLKRDTRILKTLEVFIKYEGNISDLDLANELNKLNIETSSSTVGRDLSCNLKKLFIEQNKKSDLKVEHLSNDGLSNEQANILAFITKKRKDNKHLGQIKGGTNFSLNNEALKDKDTGYFNGSTKKAK